MGRDSGRAGEEEDPMGFFEALRRVLGGGPDEAAPGPTVIEPGGIIEDSGADAGPAVTPDPPSHYDRQQWHKKLKRILDELPGSQREWDDLVVEARSLALDPGWVAQCQREEFLLLVRRAVSDRVVTEPEHRKLDLARQLIGMSEAEAEAALHDIAAEAETFFGKPVREG